MLYIWCSQIILCILIAVVSSPVSEYTVVSNFGKMAPAAFFYLILWFKIRKYYQFCLSRNKVYLYISSLTSLTPFYLAYFSNGAKTANIYIYIYTYSRCCLALENFARDNEQWSQFRDELMQNIQVLFLTKHESNMWSSTKKNQSSTAPALSTVQGIAYRTQITL